MIIFNFEEVRVHAGGLTAAECASSDEKVVNMMTLWVQWSLYHYVLVLYVHANNHAWDISFLLRV